MKTIAILNLKGGTAKTVTAAIPVPCSKRKSAAKRRSSFWSFGPGLF